MDLFKHEKGCCDDRTDGTNYTLVIYLQKINADYFLRRVKYKKISIKFTFLNRKNTTRL